MIVMLFLYSLAEEQAIESLPYYSKTKTPDSHTEVRSQELLVSYPVM